MCGIAGYFDTRGKRGLAREDLVRMSDTLRHRGPDSDGYFSDEHVGLAFRRLSIIDIQGGDQPIYNEDRSLVLICNGEIYNYLELTDDLKQKDHVFRTRSDVEVLVHLYEEYGSDLLGMLNGQFAFALYDRRNNSMLLARDHFGINPLHYTVIDGVLIFASEIKAILEHPMVRRELDLTGLDQILSFPGLVSPRTMFKGIHSLRSGHLIRVKNNEITTSEYWDLDYPQKDEVEYERSEQYYVERLTDLLTQSVKYRLNSEVPIGLYLSGGLDSSMIAAAIGVVSPETQRHAFSISFTDEEISESKYQVIAAEHLGFRRHEIVFDWSEISGRLEKMIYHCESPVKESFNTCSLALSAAAKSHGISVILAGEGADELFAGYIGYRFDQLGLRQKKQYDLDTILEDEIREKVWGDRDLFYEVNQYAFKEVKRALYSQQLNDRFDDFECLNHALVCKQRIKGRDFIHQRSYLDFKLRLSDHLLSEHGDRMNLANSVEGRYPFLDIEVVEFARKIPPDLKLNRFTEKYVLKRIAERWVPPEIIRREKFGFRAPGSPYLLQQNIEWINDLLSYDRIRRQGYFNPDTVENLKRTYRQPGFTLQPHTEVDLLMIVLSFGLFLDLFKLASLN
jgi:asparagine synthase (glutamine-hydrolysing)